MPSRLIVAALILGLLGCQGGKGKKTALENQKQKVSYSIGLDIGSNLKEGEIEIDMDALAQGIKDAMSGSTPLLTEEQVRETMHQFQQEMMTKRQESARQLAEKNKKEGEAFLAENAKKEGVITLPSGMQYKIIKQGTGRKPALTDEVTTHYRGTLIDGTEFDSSYKRGEPVSFPVNGVIAGWTEALQLMPVGSKWELFIPSKLAYGERGAGRGVIGPNATLIFEIELLAIK
ncbi:MAG: FKBP-type peptidyl-prolyl cis-trans isomerase [candidate division KSB1 bacterium]|nr:FKBP-type peptidyl-prolyl cis-trans isomerase [candidate division KSB1 bacterium]MDZ7301624.1 FKBP-type peptidyl-prolyl cis-trans isomerase [candidate division KSB1 bacterium]MDZ7310960.1 FKBP-type peptidyl-prolyl cis-trans isomerase [candidate division KSB1 bacterium]